MKCPVGQPDLGVIDTGSTSELADQPLAELAMGDSIDSGEMWVATWDQIH